MITGFDTIGIVGHPRSSNTLATHQSLYHWLIRNGYHVIIEHQIARELNLKRAMVGDLAEIGKQADLVIVVGGDGSMLDAARILACHDTKIIGINRGSFGFLTDLDPDSALIQLSNVLKGNYYLEQRFLLEALVAQDNHCSRLSTAINEVVVHHGKVARMIEFEVYINKKLAFSQRSDGLIIATPTGSTAYSLSAGGPILAPPINGITLVSMFPHTLSSRPLVINDKSTIRLKFAQSITDLEVICDSQIVLSIKQGAEIIVQRSQDCLNLIHPSDYNYFNALNKKFGWSKKLF